MTREEKLEAIYKEIANKGLNLGCKVRFDKGIYTIIDEKNVGFLDSYRGKDGNIHNTIVIEDGINSRCYSIKEVIGHPVMIGTIFERYSASKGFINSQFILALVDKWTGYDKPIEEQSDECIDFVHSLIKKS